jgi:hypothetical protein
VKSKLKRVGFFRELGYSAADAPSLKESVRDAADYDRDLVARYLRAAPLLAVAPGVVRDVLDPDASNVMTLSIKTDGVWEWPTPLAYYVQKYNVVLPEAFIAHIAGRNHRPPTREELDLPGGD